jgi:hypothetical protein
MPKKRSAWLTHVMQVKAKNKGKPFKNILQLASKSWKKSK